MNEFKKFVDTLNTEEAIKMKAALEAADDWQEMPETELVAKMISHIFQDYTVRAENAKNIIEAHKYEKRLSELLNEWKEFGFIKEK